MTTKDFLQLYAATDDKIAELNEIIVRLRSKAEKMTPSYEERIGSSSGGMNADKIPAIVEMIMQEEERTQGYIEEVAEMRKDIEMAILAVKDTKLCTLLVMRYMNAKTWHQIADTLHFSRYHVEHRLHEDALSAVKIPEKYQKML